MDGRRGSRPQRSLPQQALLFALLYLYVLQLAALKV